MRVNIIILILGLLAGCKSAKTHTNVEISDSTIVREIVRTDTVRIAGDTIRFETIIECDSITKSPKPIYIERRGVRSGAILNIASSGALIVESQCDSLTEMIESKDTEITRLRKEKRTITKVVTEFKTRWYDKIARIITVFLFGGLIAYLLVKLKP